MKFAEGRTHLRHVAQRFRQASGVTQAVAAAYGAGRLSRALSWLSLLSFGTEALLPGLSTDEWLRKNGFQEVNTDLGPFLCRLLRASDIPFVEREHAPFRIVIWGGNVAALYEGASYCAGPYLKEGADLGEIFRSVVWAAHSDVMLTAGAAPGSEEDRPRPQPRAPYRLERLEPSPPYFGSPGLDYFVKRVRAYEGHRGAGGRGRCFLIRGPTGVGKGVLARNIAKKIGDGARTLKIAQDIAKRMPVGDLTGLIRWFRPAILLIDDVDLNGWENGGSLAPFEAMRDLDGFVFCTMMDDDSTRRRRSSNNEYLDGMRPGRIDETWRLSRPDPRTREKILRYYLGRAGLRVVGDKLAAVVTQTHGLTGAYLAEVALRLRVHGMHKWRVEINAVKSQAPRIPRPRKSKMTAKRSA